RALARRWRRRRLLAAVLTALAWALPLAATALLLPLPLAARWLLAALSGGSAAALVLRRALRPVPELAVAAHLDRRVPALGESSELLLAATPLPPLAALQRQRVERALAALGEPELARLLPARALRRAAVRLLAGAAAAVAVLLVAPRLRTVSPDTTAGAL